MVARSTAQPASTATNVPPEMFFGQSFVNGDVVYNSILADDGDGDGDPIQDKNDQVIVFVTVATPAQVEPGTARRILGVYRAVVYYLPPNFVPNYAIIVNGNLHMGGSPSIQGLMGSVHTNGDLDINGGTNMVISTQGSATGNIVLTGTPPTPSGGWAPNAAPVPIPRLDPKEHIATATYILAKDGNSYNNTTSPRTLIGSGTWAGFTWDGSKNTWDKKNNTVPPPGAIYIDGSVEINGGGTAATPWRTTLLVNGNIGMEGNPFLVPYLPGVSMMAFGDIRLRGTPASFPDVNGLIATHEQIDISGTPRFRGSVLAEDVGDAFDLVTTSSRAGTEDFLDINGNF